MKMFTGNPLEGSWTDEDGNMDLKIGRNGQMTVILPASGDGEETQVPMTYTLSKESKTISIQEDDNKIQEIAEKSNGQYTEETLKNAVQSIGTTFEYSIDGGTMTLTEREYGEQMMFNKKLDEGPLYAVYRRGCLLYIPKYEIEAASGRLCRYQSMQEKVASGKFSAMDMEKGGK